MLRKNETTAEFESIYTKLLYLLNRTFNGKGRWFSAILGTNRHCDGIIEHENGTKVELWDEFLTGDEVITMEVVYPNGKSRWIAQFKLKEDNLVDMADKIYEYVVVKNPIKHEGVKGKHTLKRVNESETTDFLRTFVSAWNKKKSPKLEIMSGDTAVGRGKDEMLVVELYEDEECVKVSRYDLSSEDDYCAEDLYYL